MNALWLVTQSGLILKIAMKGIVEYVADVGLASIIPILLILHSIVFAEVNFDFDICLSFVLREEDRLFTDDALPVHSLPVDLLNLIIS